MNTTIIAQPNTRLGVQIELLLESEIEYSRIVFVSAFTALRTILRFRDRLIAAAETGTAVRLVIGIDMGGTSQEVLRELVDWNCEVFLYHNPIVRATFHPKIYLFEAEPTASLFVGSNNLTDGGMYTNYEATTRHDFNLPDDNLEFSRILAPLRPFIDPEGPTVQPLTPELIDVLSVRGTLPTEQDARRNRRARQARQEAGAEEVPPDPFLAVNVPMAPLLPRHLRPAPSERPNNEPQFAKEEVSEPNNDARPSGVVVWQKTLPRTDALQVNPGSHHVGGVRLTQARFENPPGQRIDQTMYFRNLFADYDWEPEPGGRREQEHTFVPMRIFIRDTDYGIRNFEISHKPSGEAGQDNYTTILRWGRNFNSTILGEELTDTVLRLYETPDSDAGFLIEISDS